MNRSILPKLAYAVLFVAILPLALWLWALGSATAVALAPLQSPVWGAAMLVFGILIMGAGMFALWRRGGGLPMNAFPPPRFVSGGIYALIPHPIYVGFVLACAGTSTYFGSASGQWLVTPSVALACSALVLGYELPDLRKRFGPPHSTAWLPADLPGPPSLLERVRIYLVILFPWLGLYELIGALGTSRGAFSTYLPFEPSIPVIVQAEIFYFSTYVVVTFAPLFMRSRIALRAFALRGLTAMAIVFPLYLLLPVFVSPRPFHGSAGLLGYLLSWERSPHSGVAAFPSFHVIWALIAASVLGRGRQWKRLAWWTWAVLVSISCILSGMHSIADVAAGILVFVLIVRIRPTWLAILAVAERIANSWREWHFGPVRIINHGAYAAAATLVGAWLMDTLLGPGRSAITASIVVCSIVGAALWAQWVEGSPSLLRPLGFYGGLIGAFAGAMSALALNVDLWVACAAVAVAAPWIQALGRLRCLVQGCCHGHATQSVPGIRYTHPRSRVCRLANLAGESVHATPVYSILWNIVTGAVLLRLLFLQVPATILCGVYLIISSAGRFVEEAYRGEPQTRMFGGLHIYQWIATVLMLIGAAMTCLPSTSRLQWSPPRTESLLLAAACAVFAWFVTGVDFPRSSRRFARLT